MTTKTETETNPMGSECNSGDTHTGWRLSRVSGIYIFIYLYLYTIGSKYAHTAHTHTRAHARTHARTRYTLPHAQVFKLCILTPGPRFPRH